MPVICWACRRPYMKVTDTGVCRQCQDKVDRAVFELVQHAYFEDESSEYYRTHHGLHVEDKIVEGCSLCNLRVAMQVMATMTGEDPEAAVSDATKAREITG